MFAARRLNRATEAIAKGYGETRPARLAVRGIEIELLRKDIKNLHLRVYPPDGRVRVSVPTWLSVEQVIEVVEQRFEWIRAQRLKVSDTVGQLMYLDGETHWFRGRPYLLQVVEWGGRPRVEIAGPETMSLFVKRQLDAPGRQKVLERWYRDQLRIQAGPYFEKWENELGVDVREWRIKKMSTRWGSCNVREGRVWLSLELAKKSSECLEYVVVHELAHLLEAGHGPKFRARMDEALPNWRILKKKLNTRTQL